MCKYSVETPISSSHTPTHTHKNSKHWFTPSTGLRHQSFFQPLLSTTKTTTTKLLVSWQFYGLYAIESIKLPANEQFFCGFFGAQTVVIKFVANNSSYIRRLFYN